MERIPRQSLRWRTFASVTSLLLTSVFLSEAVFVEFGLNWHSAKAMYWLIAPAGLLGYAFGFRLLSVTFWRFYAVIFTAEITLRWMRLTLSSSDGVRYGALTKVLCLGILALVCVALLRYAKLLSGGRSSFKDDQSPLREIFD
jgi:hypothetical protein